MFDRIVVAVDGSSAAEHAARTGIELAARLGVPLDVINVFERSILDALRSSSAREELRAERRALLESVEATAAAEGVTASTTLLDGTPAPQIAAFAAESGADPLIVLGRRGRSAVSRRVLGGVTERVLERGPAPVLVDPGTDGSVSDPSALVVPTDGSANAELALPVADAFASEFDAAVHLLSVVDLQRAGGVFNAGGLDTEFVGRLESRAEDAVEAARERLSGADRGAVETAVVRSTEFEGVSGAITDYASRADADLVVMGSHGRSNVRRQLLGSVTNTVVRTIDVPVLVVPRTD